MGEKIKGSGLGVGVIGEWDGKWFGEKGDYGKEVEEELGIGK